MLYAPYPFVRNIDFRVSLFCRNLQPQQNIQEITIRASKILPPVNGNDANESQHTGCNQEGLIGAMQIQRTIAEKQAIPNSTHEINPNS